MNKKIMKEEKRKRANTTKEKQSFNNQLFDLEYFISLDNENKICFDCGGPFPTYVSINNGVFICSNCSKNHEKLGYNISFIYQINSPWDQYLLSYVLRGGNSRFKQLCQEYQIPCQSFDENDEEKLNKYIIELGNYHRLTLRSEILAEEPPKSLSFDDATKKCNLDEIFFPELNDYHLYRGEMIPGKTTFGGKIWKGTKVTAKFIGHKGSSIFKAGKRILSNGTSKGLKYIGKHIWNNQGNNDDQKKNKDKIQISDYQSANNNKICLISPNNIFNDLSNGEESDEEKNIEITCSPEKESKNNNDFIIINNINNIDDDDDNNNNKEEEKEKENDNNNQIECSNEDNKNIINDDDEVIIKCDSDPDNNSDNIISNKPNDFEIY